MGSLPGGSGAVQTPLLRGSTHSNLGAESNQERQPRGSSIASASSADATPQVSTRPNEAVAATGPQDAVTPQATQQPAVDDDSKKGTEARRLSTDVPRKSDESAKQSPDARRLSTDASKQTGKMEDMTSMEYRYDETNPNVLSQRGDAAGKTS